MTECVRQITLQVVDLLVTVIESNLFDNDITWEELISMYKVDKKTIIVKFMGSFSSKPRIGCFSHYSYSYEVHINSRNFFEFLK